MCAQWTGKRGTYYIAWIAYNTGEKSVMNDWWKIKDDTILQRFCPSFCFVGWHRPTISPHCMQSSNMHATRSEKKIFENNNLTRFLFLISIEFSRSEITTLPRHEWVSITIPLPLDPALDIEFFSFCDYYDYLTRTKSKKGTKIHHNTRVYERKSPPEVRRPI